MFDVDSLKHWTNRDPESGQMIILENRESQLQLLVFPPGLAEFVEGEDDDGSGKWVLKLMDGSPFSAFPPQTLATADTKDELLGKLEAVVRRHSDIVKKAKRVLDGIGTLGIVVDCPNVMNDLTDGFVTPDWEPDEGKMAARVLFGWMYAGDIRVDRSKYDREALIKMLREFGVSESDIESRVPMFERDQDLDEDD